MSLSAAEVRKLLDGEVQKSVPSGKTEADAAGVLQNVFRRLASVEYQKTVHGPMLTECLLKNAPEELAELKELLHQMLNPDEKSSPRS